LFNRKVSPFEDSVDFVSEAPPFALLCLEGDTFRFAYMGLRLREAPPFHFVCNFYYVRNAAIIKVRIRPFEDALYCLRSATPLLRSWRATFIIKIILIECDAPSIFGEAIY